MAHVETERQISFFSFGLHELLKWDILMSMMSTWHLDMAYLPSLCFISVRKKIILRVSDKALFYLITCRKRSLGQGNVFTRVTGGSASSGGQLPGGSACRRVSAYGGSVLIGGLHPGDGLVDPPPPEPEKLAIRILLECFLVGGSFCQMSAEMTTIKDKMFGKIIIFVLLVIFEKLSSSVFQSTRPGDKYEPQHNKYSYMIYSFFLIFNYTVRDLLWPWRVAQHERQCIPVFPISNQEIQLI